MPNDAGETAPEIRGSAEAGVAYPGATVAGVLIETLSLGAADPQDIFNRVVRAPLEALYSGGFDRPITLLVDALDESVARTGGVSNVDLLGTLEHLPLKVRFIVTSRDDDEVLGQVRRPNAPVEERSLSSGRGLDDGRNAVRRYVIRTLAERPELAAKLSPTLPPDAFAAEVQKKERRQLPVRHVPASDACRSTRPRSRGDR